MDLHLKDKVALVTGGSRGLGKGICQTLAAEGVKLAINYYRNAAKDIDFADEAEAVAEQLREAHGIDVRTSISPTRPRPWPSSSARRTASTSRSCRPT